MKGKLSRNIKYLILSLLLIVGFDCSLSGQKSISGAINSYGRVTSIGAGSVVVSDPTQFSYFQAGDTVLLIQMKGVKCLVTNDGTYGTIQMPTIGTTGAYEFLTIESVTGGSNTITFRNNILNSYNVLGDVQLIKVPSYNAAKVDAELNCAAWDSNTKVGGVLTFFVGTTLTLNANINVKAKGFKGGNAVIGLGNCIESGPGLNNFSYPDSYQNSGLKGESQASYSYPGLVPLYPNYAKGYGANSTGGGGGNGRFSGGGGGTTIGAGGNGGLEKGDICSIRELGGIGGKTLKNDLLTTGLYLGAGGGSSTYLSGATPSAGGKGGGIVIIVCETLDGNGFSILTDGETPVTTASGNAGSGGGGGGGTLALYLQNLSANNITLSAKGGAGGNNAGTFGEGGGGGGGRITVSMGALPGNVTRSVAGGSYGTRSGIGHEATSGTAGDNNTVQFIPKLNGFLFNSIYSTVTKNQVDSICSNVIPPAINGTSPVGGSGTYSYTWQKKYSLIGLPSIIAGATSPAYTPIATEANTHWIRRIVKDEVSLLTDTSKWVQMIVQPAITGNLVGKDTTICYGQNPLPLIPLNAGPSNGNGHYAYQWLSNIDMVTWTNNAPGTSNQASYDPDALTVNTYYKRKVTSGRCVDNSATVTITVLPLITGNVTARPDSIICEGSLFNVLGASGAGGGGGPGSYLYLWQDSTSSSIWLPAAGINSNTTYSADTSKFAVIEDRFYRRVVFSGPDNVCRNNSSRIHLTRYHKIKNNLVSADQTICIGSIPIPLTGTAPTQGNLVYTYLWQDSVRSGTWTARGTLGTPYSPAALFDSTWYRRIVNSSKCTNKSNIVVINVHKPIVNNVTSLISGPGPDTTICSGAIPNKITGSVPTGGTDIPGSYAYQWSSSPDNVTFTDITTSGTLQNYQPGALAANTYFRRRAISGMCSSFSNSIRVIVLPPITNNIIAVSKPAVCFNTVPPAVTGTSLTGGAGGTPTWIWQQSTNGITWIGASGTANQQNYSPPALLVKTWYRRIIMSGLNNCCIDTSNVVTIDINPLPTGVITNVADTTICSGLPVILKVHLTGAPNWTVVFLEGSTPVTVNSISAADYTISRIPVPTSFMTTFNYSLSSVTDNNGCVATSLAGTKKANVYRVPNANAGPDDGTCGPKYTLAAVASDGVGTWTFPPQVLAFTANDPHSLIEIDSSYTAASVKYRFYWEEINWNCTDKDSVDITFYNRIDTIDAGTGGPIFTFDNVTQLNAYPIQSFESGKWSVVTGTGNFENDAAITTYVKNISVGINTYRWTITNGDCILTDDVSFDVANPVIPEGISPDGDLINDTLRIDGLDLVNQVVELSILNGAGNLVFSASNRNGNKWVSWDGKSSKGKELPEGTYYYLLKVSSSERVAQKSGFIILKRY